MAQSQGLNRDGTYLGLPPFEVEMRRRLWWYIVTLDARLTEIIGAESSLLKTMDTQLPSNANDADLRPDMSTFPKNRVGATEMTFCLARYEIASFFHQRGNPRPEFQSSSNVSGTVKTGAGEKRGLPSLESLLEEKYLRFCDPVVPVQFLATTMARSTLCKFKQMALHKIGRQTPEEGHPQAQQQQQSYSQQQLDQQSINLEKKRQRTFSLAARNLQYDNLIHANKSLHGYLWFVDFHIPWGGPVYILKSLAYHPDWDDSMQAAWRQIEELYEHHPEYLESERVLHLIISGLTLKAWAAREAALTAQGILDPQPPPIIIALQAGNVHRSMQALTGATGSDCVQANMSLSDINGLDAITSSDLDLVDTFLAAGDWANWSPQ
jgi:Fungal specific transcription factor domain